MPRHAWPHATVVQLYAAVPSPDQQAGLDFEHATIDIEGGGLPVLTDIDASPSDRRADG